MSLTSQETDQRIQMYSDAESASEKGGIYYMRYMRDPQTRLILGVSLGNGKYCTLRLKIDHQTPKDLGKIYLRCGSHGHLIQ